MARKRVSLREFVNAAGMTEVGSGKSAVGVRNDEAVAARYTLLDADEKTPVKSWELAEDSPGIAMWARFGFHTKIGNVANSVLNDVKAPGTPQDAMAEIDAFLALVASGKWLEPADGSARTPRYDRDILAIVVHTALGAAAKGDVAHYRTRLDDDKYFRQIIAARVGDKAIKDLYAAELVARGIVKPAVGKALGDLA